MKNSLATLLVLSVCIIGCTSSPKTAAETKTDNISLEDSALFRLVQEQTFRYFMEGAEPTSGLSRERVHTDGFYPEKDQMVVTSGGGGFGVMALIVGIERGFITREAGLKRFETIVSFLERADRFHGAWPHWWNGETGKVKPFGRNDDGGDLVETSFMLQGLLCVRQYYNNGTAEEKAIAARIDKLWKEVEFDWYTQGKNVLYWHWSPNKGWIMNFPVKGFNECQIMYILAASSPTHGVSADVYHQGWSDSGKINSRKHVYKGDTLNMHHQGNPPHGGPLFWAHYSYLGLDPRGLKDKYGDYWKEMTTQARINYNWCVDNPKNFKGYGPDSWGLSASYSLNTNPSGSLFDIGYSAHAPDSMNDIGVISPTAALSSFPYTPAESMAAMKHWYNDTTMRNKLWGIYGFYDAFSESNNFFPARYLAIDQGPIVVMMENHRSGLLWNLFMSCPEVQNGLRKLGFESPWLK